jgi:hypothetical protein
MAADVAGPVIEGPRLAFGSEDRHAAFALDVVLPLVRIRMPVQFAQSARVQFDQRGGDRLEAGKFMESTIRTEPPAIRFGPCCSRRWLKVWGTGPEPLFRSSERAHGSSEQERCRAPSAGAFAVIVRRPEVLRWYVARRVRKPVGQQECRLLGEIAVVGHQQEFAAVDVVGPAPALRRIFTPAMAVEIATRGPSSRGPSRLPRSGFNCPRTTTSSLARCRGRRRGDRR